MRMHETTLTVYSWNRDWSVCNISHLRFTFESDDKKAPRILLKEIRQRLKRIKNFGRKRFSILCVPIFKTKKVGDGTKMLRNRYKFNTMSSIMRVGAKRLFVKGYGYKQAEELDR